MHLVPTFGWLFFKAGKGKQVCDMQALGILKADQVPSLILCSLQTNLIPPLKTK